MKTPVNVANFVSYLWSANFGNDDLDFLGQALWASRDAGEFMFHVRSRFDAGKSDFIAESLRHSQPDHGGRK